MAIYYDFAKLLNCKVRDVGCLMKKSVDDILKAQYAVELNVTSLRLMTFFEPWLPFIDGKTVYGQGLEFEKWKLPKNFQFKP